MFSGGFDSIGKSLIYLSIIITMIGVLIYFGAKVFNFGRLPGDIRIEKENFGFYFPIVSSIVISIILTIVLNLFTRR